MEEVILRDSASMADQYVEEDLMEFMSVQKMEILRQKVEKMICMNNQLHEGEIEIEGNYFCTQCDALMTTIRKVK